MNKLLMKYITFAIMAALILGVAASPVVSNGFAFAQADEKQQASDERKDKAEERKQASEDRKETADDRKQVSEDRKDKADEKHQASKDIKEQHHDKTDERKQISKDKKEQHRANFEELKAKLSEKFSHMNPDIKQKLQEKLDAMKEKRASMPHITDQRKSIEDMSDEDRQNKIQEIREQKKLEREERQNMTAEQRQALIEQRIAEFKEKKENYVSPRNQIGLGLSPDEIICSDDKELVIKSSDGMPRCLGADAVIVLMDRGIVAYPE